jgi:hypothetical protein
LYPRRDGEASGIINIGKALLETIIQQALAKKCCLIPTIGFVGWRLAHPRMKGLKQAARHYGLKGRVRQN